MSEILQTLFFPDTVYIQLITDITDADDLSSDGVLTFLISLTQMIKIQVIAVPKILSKTSKQWRVTKEALNCTASIAADSIVDAISFITGVLFCDTKQFKQVIPKSASGSRWIWVPESGQVHLLPDFK